MRADGVQTTTVPNEFWRIVSGKSVCEIQDGGRCVTDGNGNYGNNENCEVMALKPLVVTAEYYDVEKNYDYVTIKGIKYRSYGPNQVNMGKSQTWTWRSDGSNNRPGFKLCASTGCDINLVALPCIYICVHVCMYLCMYVFMYV